MQGGALITMLQILITVLANAPSLITDIEAEIAKIKDDATWQAKTKDAIAGAGQLLPTLEKIISDL